MLLYLFRIKILFICITAATCSYAQKLKTLKNAKIDPIYLLLDYNSGMILDEKSKDQRIHPSSMTKILTIYVLLSQIKSGAISLSDKMTVTGHAKSMEGSRSFLEEGMEVSVDDLIRCIIVHSGNDASIVIAENISGSVEKFAELMNETAKKLGAVNSNFTNPSGLPDSDHYSTINDIAIICRRLISDFPEYYEYFSQKELEINGVRQVNRNRLLWNEELGVDGLKTGHSSWGGYGVAVSALKNGVRLIAVVNGYKSSKARELEAKKLLSFGFRSLLTYNISKKNVPIAYADVWLGKEGRVPLITEKDVSLSVLKTDIHKVKLHVSYITPIQAPIKANDHVGDLTIERGNMKQVHQLLAGNDVEILSKSERIVAAIKFMIFGSSKK